MDVGASFASFSFEERRTWTERKVLCILAAVCLGGNLLGNCYRFAWARDVLDNNKTVEQKVGSLGRGLLLKFPGCE